MGVEGKVARRDSFIIRTCFQRALSARFSRAVINVFLWYGVIAEILKKVAGGADVCKIIEEG